VIGVALLVPVVGALQADITSEIESALANNAVIDPL
jgi:hypothetical protein